MNQDNEECISLSSAVENHKDMIASSSVVYEQRESESVQLCADLVFQSCRCLELSIMVAGTAVGYLHKLAQYLQKEELSGKYLSSGIPAIIYLACKTKEQLKPIRDIFNVVYVLRVGESDPEKLFQLYKIAKKDIILLEHQLIRVLNFSFDVELAYPYILNAARLMELSRRPLQMALMCVNDCLISPNFLQFSASALAIASLYCALQVYRVEIQKGTDGIMRTLPDGEWWKRFGINDEELRECVKFLISVRK